MNPNIDAIDTQTFFLADHELFLVVDFDPCVEDGPLACCVGGCFPGGVCLGDGKNGVPEVGGVSGVVVVGGDNGDVLVVVELNEFPSFLKLGMASNLSGIGPMNRLFSTFKSSNGRSCRTSKVPES